MHHVSGKMLYTADALSRNQDHFSVHQEADASTKYTDCFINAIVSALPASNDQIAVYKTTQAMDPVCQLVIQFCLEGWPDQRTWPKELHPNWCSRHELTTVNNLLLMAHVLWYLSLCRQKQSGGYMLDILACKSAYYVPRHQCGGLECRVS